MITIVLMVLVTAISIFILVETGRAGKAAAAEIVMSRGWSNRFARQVLEEKKAEYLEKNEKYHADSAKKAEKKVKEWDKQIAAYQKKEDVYLAGKCFFPAGCNPAVRLSAFGGYETGR